MQLLDGVRADVIETIKQVVRSPHQKDELMEGTRRTLETIYAFVNAECTPFTEECEEHVTEMIQSRTILLRTAPKKLSPEHKAVLDSLGILPDPKIMSEFHAAKIYAEMKIDIINIFEGISKALEDDPEYFTPNNCKKVPMKRLLLELVRIHSHLLRIRNSSASKASEEEAVQTLEKHSRVIYEGLVAKHCYAEEYIPYVMRLYYGMRHIRDEEKWIKSMIEFREHKIVYEEITIPDVYRKFADYGVRSLIDIERGITDITCDRRNFIIAIRKLVEFQKKVKQCTSISEKKDMKKFCYDSVFVEINKFVLQQYTDLNDRHCDSALYQFVLVELEYIAQEKQHKVLDAFAVSHLETEDEIPNFHHYYSEMKNPLAANDCNKKMADDVVTFVVRKDNIELISECIHGWNVMKDEQCFTTFVDKFRIHLNGIEDKTLKCPVSKFNRYLRTFILNFNYSLLSYTGAEPGFVIFELSRFYRDLKVGITKE